MGVRGAILQGVHAMPANRIGSLPPRHRRGGARRDGSNGIATTDPKPPCTLTVDLPDRAHHDPMHLTMQHVHICTAKAPAFLGACPRRQELGYQLVSLEHHLVDNVTKGPRAGLRRRRRSGLVCSAALAQAEGKVVDFYELLNVWFLQPASFVLKQ